MLRANSAITRLVDQGLLVDLFRSLSILNLPGWNTLAIGNVRNFHRKRFKVSLDAMISNFLLYGLSDFILRLLSYGT